MTSRPQDNTRQASAPGKGPRLLTVAGCSFLLLYVGYYVLMLSKGLWESPTLVPDKWKSVFRPVRDIFPREWLMARKGSELALLDDLLYLLLVVALFAIYLLVVAHFWRGGAAAARESGGGLRRILCFTALILAVLFVVHGSLSSDLHSYAWYGRILAIYGDNPLVSAPADYAWSDRAKWIQWLYWKETPSVYGPVWLWVAAGVAKVAQVLDNDIVTHLLGHKAVASAAHLCNVVLLWHVAGLAFRKYGASLGEALRYPLPDGERLASLRVAATVTYAWSPLAVIEFGANGHNDVLMLTCILCALWLHLKGKWPLAVVALAAAVLVKLVAVALVPGYLWLLLWEGRTESPAWDRESWRSSAVRVAQAALIFSVLIILAYIPFWESSQALKAIAGGPPSTRTANSLADVLKNRGAEWLSVFAHEQPWYPYRFWEPTAIASRLDWPLRWGPMLIAASWAVVRTWGARSFRGMLNAWGWVLLVYLTVASVWYWPWYASWLLVPVALLGPGRLMKASLALTGSSLLLYAFFPIAAPPFAELPKWAGLIIMSPPLLYLLGAWTGDRISERRAGQVPGVPPLPSNATGWLPAAVPVPLRPEPLLAASPDVSSAQSQHYMPDARHEELELF